MVRETRHLWVGNLPEHVREEKIVEHFKRYGRVESVKVLRKRGSEGGVAAFVDFVDIKSAQKAHNAVNKMGDRDLRTDYNEPGSVPSAVRGLDDGSPSSSHGREVSGFSRTTVGPVYGPTVSLHTREGRYERRLDGSSETRERAYEPSPYGHHDRSAAFERPRHYNSDYYRDRAVFATGVAPGAAVSAITGGFETPEAHFESRIRDPFALTSSARRDPYRDDRGRRVDRNYHHRRSRSSHSSQSRHPSPQRTPAQTPKAPHSPKRTAASPGRGPRSQSRSRSSSSDSVSSTSSTGSGSDSNSSSSEGSRARSVQSAATHVPPAPPALSLDCDEPRRSFGIRVQNLPVRSTDTSLKDGLFHEFKKYGKVTSVQIHGASEERYGLVFFRQQEDQEKALSVSKGKLFFGMLIEVTAWNGPETESENEFRPLDGRIDEFHPKATRTLFIGNLEKTTNYQQLLDVFQRFGEIVDIDIKRVNGVPQYAFVQYSDIASVCKAIKKMDGEYLGTNRLKLGFGKSMPTTCVWLDGLSSNITEQYLTRHFCRYGHVVKVVFDRMKGMALILYNNTDFAQAAVRETKGWKIGGNKIKVDFASQESQMAFYRSMQASGQDIRDFYEIPTERRDDRRPPYHEFSAERAYYENVRTPGIYAEDPRRDYPARSRERYTELDHYQADHYDPRYHEDPREYRDYRDPFEQDIRKYSYIQRERERERERFEADRGRWSPSHQRRPITPTASPSPSERVTREAERRVYRHSSERSGSCSSLSPPQPTFEKPEKSPVDYKTESLEREIELAETDRVSGAEKSKRGRRKEKTDREKGEKIKSRRGKVQSPSILRSEADREPSLESNSGKIKAEVDGTERQRHKAENEPSPLDPALRLEPQKGEKLEQVKSESLDKDSKGRSKKHLKSEPGNEVKEPTMDSDRLAARKRRFGDPSGKTIRQKRGRLEDEQNAGVGQPTDIGANSSFTKEAETDAKTLEKEAQKREFPKSKSERIPSHLSQREELDHTVRVESQISSVRQGEHSESNVELSDPKSLLGPSVPRQLSKDETPEKDKGREDYLDIDLSQSYRKQMEQNRRLQQQLQESDKPGKPESSQCVDTEDFEHRSLVHEVGKPPQDVTDNSPSCKSKKQEHFEMDATAKRERVYRTSRPKSEDSEWNNTHSPRFQHVPQHAEDEFTEVPLLPKEVKEQSKPEENAHTDLDLKRIHAAQVSKQSTPLLDEQQKRWENRLKHDLLPDFSRSSGKRRLNRKYLEYGLWPDLEPGEVRSDSEEDREHKPISPMPSTSMSFPERHRGDRFSESKLTISLERNKFYSFALDQTITPDTKALLERAKSLSSSREDNWSFLDSDSHFATFRSRKDTEKVESTPRPTPSWYMKKKKIRSESEDKIDDRKEDPKPEEQERRELFASRFLHSSIFEQDSRRLQHLERKHEDPELGAGYPGAQQGQGESQPDSEPVVLFHDRFLELTRLQQQKVKDKTEHESKKVEYVDGKHDEKSQDVEEVSQPHNTEPNIQRNEVKSISPVQAPQTSPAQTLNVNSVQETQILPTVLTAKEVSPQLETKNIQAPSPKQLDLSAKEEKLSEQLFASPSVPQEMIKDSNSPQNQETKPLVNEIKLSPTNNVESAQNRDVEQFPKSDAQATNIQVSCDPENETQTELSDLQNSPSPMIVDESDKLEKPEPLATETEPSVKDVDSKCVETVEEPLSPPLRSRNKKVKTSPTPAVAPLTTSSTPDKQSTRKSERIDREKLKRSSSPRGEPGKATSEKSSGKSPIHSPDPEQNVEQSVPPVRARRRNVRSVYATVVEGESAPQTGKDVESPRSARKRGSDKDSGQQQQPEQETVSAPATLRRGRPPKNRRQVDDLLAGKSDRAKITETKESDANETGSSEAVTKVGKGKHSPYLQKTASQATLVSGVGKKGDKLDKMSGDNTQKVESSELDADSQASTNQPDSDPSHGNESKEKNKPQTTVEAKQDKDKITPVDKGTGIQDKLDSNQEQATSDKSGKTKPTRLNRNSKLMAEDKSLGLKNLRIRLDVTEVKVRLQTGETESGHDDISKKSVVVASPKEHLLEPRFEKNVLDDADSKEDSVPVPTKVKDPHEELSRELELEQAVENIAKLTEEPTPLQFKSPSEADPPLSNLVEEPAHEPEVEKPANPASETELAAAIDSITSEDNLPQDPVMNSVMDSVPPIQTLVQDAKSDESNSATIREETSNTGTPRKGAKGRAKAQKRAKGQKASVNRKEVNKDTVADMESLPLKAIESIPELPTVTETSPPATAVVITPTSKQDMNLTVNVPDVPKATEVPLKEQPDLPKSSRPVANKSPIPIKPQPNPYECTSPSVSPTSICLKPSHLSRLPVSPADRVVQSKESTVLSPSVPPSAASDNPTLPPDSSHDINTSDLRKILTKQRSIPVPDICAMSGTMLARESDAKRSPHENRQSSLPAQPVVRTPASLPSPETKQVFSEKSVISVIASTATSVISRVCNPPESEDKSSIPIGNPFVDKQPPKQMYQPSIEDSSTYHGPTVGEEGGNAGRYIVESTSLSSGPTAGLRVNTSEGVVVLSHSGQKIEGRQRISAKISQIPPPSAVDIESQQLVSMPQIKQELYSASQPATPKASLPPSDHVHALKTQPIVPSIKQESGMDKLDAYVPVPSGVVKRLQQAPGPSQVIGFHPSEYGMVVKHPKKEGNEPICVDSVKPAWVSTISPAISPHLPSPAGNHVGFIPGTPTDRAPSHIQPKQEPRSPRKSGHPHSPFVPSPIGSSSPKAVSMVLPTGLPPMSQYVSSVHHSEQSVIMPPHSTHGNLGRMSPHRVGQTIPLGHLSQGEVRVNTPPLSMMNYGIHSEGIASNWPPGQQRPTSPQAVGNREMVLKVNPANTRGHEGGEEEARRFHQALGRPPATQLKPESIPAEYRGPIHSGLPLDRFNVSPRDMRMLMHHQQAERQPAELHQGHIAEAVPQTSTPTSIAASLSPRSHLLQKGISDKDSLKQSELKRTSSPTGKEGIIAIRSGVPSMASPQRVQLIPSGAVPGFPEYSGMYTNALRTVHSQFSDSASLGIAQPPRNTSQGVHEQDHSQAQGEVKVEHVGHQQVNMVQLLTKYPIVWQGLLALKNDTAAVQLHFVCGNKALGLRSLPVPCETGALLRIVQRMRLETPQLEGVARRMTGESDFCLLLAMPCGRDQDDVVNQTQALKSAFINYLKAKLAAGIINVPNPGSNQPAYVLQIFPPCEFSESHLSRLAPDLLSQISSISPHLMIVITSV
ncbi:msx2-interacting protein isoform X2 [Hoplias malabaricus]|uniref:msx2-interacting protein isoform X2 n=1 Tax=Hoplias malabaricus TaxID=27720 RepID=UPI0034619704